MYIPTYIRESPPFSMTDYQLACWAGWMPGWIAQATTPGDLHAREAFSQAVFDEIERRGLWQPTGAPVAPTGIMSYPWEGVAAEDKGDNDLDPVPEALANHALASSFPQKGRSVTAGSLPGGRSGALMHWLYQNDEENSLGPYYRREDD